MSMNSGIDVVPMILVSWFSGMLSSASSSSSSRGGWGRIKSCLSVAVCNGQHHPRLPSSCEGLLGC